MKMNLSDVKMYFEFHYGCKLIKTSMITKLTSMITKLTSMITKLTSMITKLTSMITKLTFNI